MVDAWIYGTAIPVYSDVDNYICAIAAVFAGGECGSAELVVSATNWVRPYILHKQKRGLIETPRFRKSVIERVDN